MPIQFPRPTGPNHLFERQWLLELKSKYFRTNAPNYAGVGLQQVLLAPGMPITKAYPNVRDLGTNYKAVYQTAIVNPAAALNIRRDATVPYSRVGARLVMTISGVSRDATGVALGGCRILVFRTADNTLVGETISDGAGAWSLTNIAPVGALFYVEYKAGAPDIFGTSPNTNTAIVV